jgi:UrcA family protein
MNKYMIMAAVVAAATLGTGVHAADDLTVRGSRSADATGTIRVPYGDLSLTSADNAQVLRTRVNRAIQKGCGNLYGSAQPSQEWTCHKVAWEVATPQLNQVFAAAKSGQTMASKEFVLRFASR